ncbi:MAG: hypothetical protein ABJF11_05185 [Reichenbachiella sp.]|uniref:hypothetical protein n=1 Tax=Reichenbachiella sp. TaxID=2184521 RepID=UPI0032672CDB
MRSCCLLVLAFPLFFQTQTLSGQDPTDQDSLVLIQDLRFSSDFEATQFRKLLAGEEVVFEALMAINLEARAQNVQLDKQMFFNEIGQLKQISSATGSGELKYYKQIYDHVHERFFQKYELSHYFNEVFSNGTYNCVSGTAIYALIFEELDIAYSIKETPTHVYIVLESNGNQYLLETTDPTGKFNKFSKNFKSHFIRELEEAKLISSQEVQSSNTEALFEKYYFTDINLTLTQLVGVQYWNDAVYKFRKEDYDGAIHALQKCYLLYPNDKVKEMLLASLGIAISKTSYSIFEEVSYLASLSRFSEPEVSDVQLKNEFLRLNAYQLIDQGNQTLYTRSYNYLMAQVSRKSLRSEIDFVYNYERARLLHNRGRYRTAIKYAEQAFDLKPANLDAETLFLSTLSQYLQYSNDQQESYNMLDSLVSSHGSLMENNKFGGLFLDFTLIQMADLFGENKKTEGSTFKDKFENLYDENPGYQVNKDLIGHAYSRAAVYYFRRGYYTSAKKILQKGMSYAPYNHELKTRMRAIND